MINKASLIAWAKQGNLKQLKTFTLDDNEKIDCLKEATKYNRLNIVKYLLYEIELPELILIASKANSFEVTKFLVEQGYDVNFCVYKIGPTVLYFFIKHENVTAIEYVLSKGATLNFEVIDMAQKTGSYDVVKLLIEHADKNVILNNPSLLLSSACHNRFKIANLFIEVGLNFEHPFIKTQLERTYKNLLPITQEYITNQKIRYILLNI